MAGRPLLHLVMGNTGPEGVIEALQLLGRDERVICPHDEFAAGPLRPLRRSAASRVTVKDGCAASLEDGEA